jgi:hypothetical protein
LLDQSPVGLFLKVYRNFGLATATRASYYRLRGRFFPALALKEMSLESTAPREVTFLLSTAEHDSVTLRAIVDLLAYRNRSDWEVCICARGPVTADMALTLSRVRGTKPWIRIIATDESVDAMTSAQWTVEQATGCYVALAAHRFAPHLDAVGQLLHRLRGDSASDTAALKRIDAGAGGQESRIEQADCPLLLQRKLRYLEVFQGRWPLTATAAVGHLRQMGAAVACVELRGPAG